MTPFSQRLKALREKSGLSQIEVASKIGVPANTYGNYERGQREPDFEITKKLARFFKVSVDYLIGETNDPNPNSPAEIPPAIEIAFRDVTWEDLSPETQNDLAEYIRWRVATSKKSQK